VTVGACILIVWLVMNRESVEAGVKKNEMPLSLKKVNLEWLHNLSCDRILCTRLSKSGHGFWN